MILAQTTRAISLPTSQSKSKCSPLQLPAQGLFPVFLSTDGSPISPVLRSGPSPTSCPQLSASHSCQTIPARSTSCRTCHCRIRRRTECAALLSPCTSGSLASGSSSNLAFRTAGLSPQCRCSCFRSACSLCSHGFRSRACASLEKCTPSAGTGSVGCRYSASPALPALFASNSIRRPPCGLG